MMASAVRSYIKRYAATPAKRIALFTNNEDGWRTVETAIAAGLQIAAVVDARPDISAEHRALASKAGFPVLNGSVTGVDGGKDGVRKISVALGGSARAEIEADGLAVSGGWNPAVGLTSYHRGRPKWRDDIAAFVPDGAPPGMVAAGAANGDFGLGACLRQGFAAGAAAAADSGHHGNPGTTPTADDEAFSLTPLWHVAGKGKAFVDLQNDVTASDIELAQREGFEAVEHLKRYTTLGMATDQGKTSNVPGLAIMAAVTGKSIPETGTTIYRPPYVPVAIGAFAGHHRDENFHSVRLTPSHHWAAEQGAVFVDTGLWKRAQWYPQPGETDWLQSVTREVKAVRAGVGFCDVSTLGKIDVHGPDAGAFLDRVYINTFSNLAVGKARYGLMLREDGLVYDDGTTSRLADDHYFLTTTTAKAGLVMQHLEFCRQVLFPELDVQLTSVSDQWAQFSIAGPEDARPAAGDRRPGRRSVERGLSVHGRARGGAARRHPGAAVPHLLLRRDGVRDLRAGALRRCAGAQSDDRRQAVRRDALRHRGARRHAHREGPRRRPRAERHDDGRRSRAGQDDVDQEGFRRPRHGRTRGAGRAGPPGRGRHQAGRSRRAACAPARTSSRRMPRRARRPTRAMSARSASRRCSTSGSGWGWSSAAASASARSCKRTIRCAARTTRSSCAAPSSTIRKEGASVAEFVWTSRSPLQHALVPGPYGAAWRARHFADGNPQFRAGPGDGAARPLGRSRRCRAGAFRRGHALWAEGGSGRKRHADLVGAGPVPGAVARWRRRCADGEAAAAIRRPRLADRPVACARHDPHRRPAGARHAGKAVVDRPASVGFPAGRGGRDLDRPHQRQSVARQRSCRRAGGVQPAGLRDLCREPVAHHAGRGGRIRRRCRRPEDLA